MSANENVSALSLRRAALADAYALWIWANDAATRAASFGRDEVPWEAHYEWLSDRLEREDNVIFIAFLDNGVPIGSVRFDTTNEWRTVRLSYVVAPEARGRGHGSNLLTVSLAAFRDLHPSAEVYAEVARDNERSLRAFRRAPGWVETESLAGQPAVFWSR